MDMSAIFTNARARSYSSSSQYSDSELLPFANIRYHQIENLLTTLKEDYFYDVITTDTIANQNRYTMKSSSATVEGVKKVISTSIRWATNDQYPVKMFLGDTNNNPVSLEELSSEQPKDQGFYVIKGTEIIIYPTPLNAVVGGLTQEVIVNLKDLTTTSPETDIFATTVDGHSELRQYHYIIAIGLAADIMGMKGLFNEKQILENEYSIELQRLTSAISDRYSSPIEGQLLNTSSLK